MKIEYIGKTLLITVNGKKILVIGDMHLGYEESLNLQGVFVGRKAFEEMMEDLDEIFAKVGKVNEIVLLGDVKHDFGGILKQERDDAIRVLNYSAEKCERIIITKGNHDNILRPMLKGKGRIDLVEYYVIDNVGLMHGDKKIEEILEDKKIEIVVVGHLHPAIKLREGDVKIEKYKCFLSGRHKGREWIIVPSFSEYYEGTDPRENEFNVFGLNLEKFNVKIVSEKELEVLDFGKLKDIK